MTLIKILTALLIPIFASEAFGAGDCETLYGNARDLCKIGKALQSGSDDDVETAAGAKGDEPPLIIFGPRDRNPDPVNNPEAPSWRRSKSVVESQVKETAEDLYLTPKNRAGDPQPYFGSCRAEDCRGASFTVPLGAPPSTTRSGGIND